MSYFLTHGPSSIACVTAAVPHEPLLIVMLGPALGVEAVHAAMREAGLQPVVTKGAGHSGFHPQGRGGIGDHAEEQLLRRIGSYSTSADPGVGLATVMQLRDGAWDAAVRPPIPSFRKQVYAVLTELARTYRRPRTNETADGGPGGEGADDRGLGWSWVLVEDGDWHRSKAMVVMDVVARGRHVAGVEQQGPDVLRITTSQDSASTVDAACAALSWVAGDEAEQQWLARMAASCTRLYEPIHRPLHLHSQAGGKKEEEGEEGREGGVNPWPSVEEGLRVFEFFSGIGGMRLGLPSHVRGVPLAHVTAFDCSTHALQVYEHNFPDTPTSGLEDGPARLDNLEGSLRNLLIDGLKLGDVDGKADIWTMSPPCQPYTTTRLARRLDAQDNRARPLSHLLSLLRHMRQRPRYIVLENVKGFVGSDMLEEVRSTLRACGYTYRQLLLSPIHAAALPNHRMRFYLIAQHRGGTQAQDDEAWDPDLILEQFPPRIRSRYATETPPLSAFLLPGVSPQVLERLLLPKAMLDKPWAATQISIVGQHDRGTYCFSKGYSRIVDRSTGSCLLMDADGPLADPEYAVDRTKPLSELYGRLRRFDPDEICAISGFPPAFSWPPSLKYEKRWACIGNSVNVAVVRGVMACLFEPDAFD